MRRGLALLTVAGCNQVLGVHQTHRQPDAGEALCDPLPYDPARYQRAQPQSAGFTWNDARTACQSLGADLAVIDTNDTMEIANELTGGTVPFWLGVSYDGAQWAAIDTCTPVLVWANGEPMKQSIGQCLLQDFGGMISFDCTSQQAGPGISALCETPRPTTSCRLAAMQRDYVVASKTAVLRATAQQMCSDLGRHLVEIDSSDELTFLSQNHADVPDYWLGATRAGNVFTSPTGCPQVFNWTGNNPSPSPQDCTFYNGGVQSDYCDTTFHAVICEAN